MSFGFFLSYARINSSPALIDFDKRLVAAVHSKVGGAIEDAGFRDVPDIPPGGEWRQFLVDALSSSRCFVPLCTASYFEREACGKEWGGFRSRMAATPPGGGPAPRTPAVFFPIYWADKRSVLRAAGDWADKVNWYTPPEEFLGPYEDPGLLMMMQQDRFQDACTTIIGDLANRIAATVGTELGRLPIDSLQAIPNAFARAQNVSAAVTAPAGVTLGSDNVIVVVVAGRESELRAINRMVDAYGADASAWKPFMPPNGAKAAALAQNVISNLNWMSTVVHGDDRLVELLEQAEEAGRVTVLIVDPWTLKVERYQNMMKAFDKEGRKFLNNIVLVPWNLDDDETKNGVGPLTTTLGETFRKFSVASTDPISTLVRVSNSDQFTTTLSRALEAARGRLLQLASGQAAAGPPILNNAPGGQ